MPLLPAVGPFGQYLRRVGVALILLGALYGTAGSTSREVTAAVSPTPLLWLDGSNPNSYPGTGTTWTDLSPNGSNGTLVGAVSYNSTTKAFEFPGGTNGTAYVSLNADMSNFTNGLTLEFEGEFGAVRSTWERIFDFALGVGQVSNSFWVGQFENLNELALESFNNGVSQGYCYTATNGTALGSAGDRTLNKWVVTLDATSPFNCRIYKNGVEIGTRTTTFPNRNLNPTGANANGSPYALPLNTSRPSSYLGRSNFLQDRDLEGSIRYIRLYNQTLTPSQVSDNATSTVTFDANGGSGTMANQTSGTSAALTSNAFTRAGYIFSGWNTAANGSGVAYANGATYPFSSSTTLFAQWSVDPNATTTTTAATTTTTIATTTTTVAPTTTTPAATTTVAVSATPTTTVVPVTTTTVSDNNVTESDVAPDLVSTGTNSDEILTVSVLLMWCGACLVMASLPRRTSKTRS